MKYSSQSHRSQNENISSSERRVNIARRRGGQHGNHAHAESYMAALLPVRSVFIVSLILIATVLLPIGTAYGEGGPCLVETVYELWYCTNDSDIEATVARVRIYDNPDPSHPTFIHCGPSGEITTIWQDGEIVLEELVTDIELQPNKMTILTDGSKLMVFGNQPIGYNTYRGQLVQPLQAHLVCTPQGFPPKTW